jgi:drug/metabolite transporter (DMT)-like permease
VTPVGAVRCALAAVLFGAATPAVSRLADDLSPFLLAGLLYLGAALAVLPWVLHDAPDRRAWRASRARLAVAVVSGGLLGPVLLMAALGRAPASTVSLMLNLEVVFTVLLAGLVFGEALGRRVLAGAGVVALAAVTLGWSGDVQLRIGAVFVVLACAAWAVDNSVTAHLDTLMPHHITMAKGAMAGSVNLAIGLTAGGAVDVGSAVAALAIGAIGYGASITLWIGGAQRIGAARGQVIFAVAPFVGVVTAWLVLGEAFGPRSVVAMTLAAGGVALVVTAPRLTR